MKKIIYIFIILAVFSIKNVNASTCEWIVNGAHLNSKHNIGNDGSTKFSKKNKKMIVLTLDNYKGGNLRLNCDENYEFIIQLNGKNEVISGSQPAIISNKSIQFYGKGYLDINSSDLFADDGDFLNNKMVSLRVFGKDYLDNENNNIDYKYAYETSSMFIILLVFLVIALFIIIVVSSLRVKRRAKLNQ